MEKEYSYLLLSWLDGILWLEKEMLSKIRRTFNKVIKAILNIIWNEFKVCLTIPD